MIKNETRESAHLRSRVKDLSAVPNLVNFTGLFAAITPIAKLEKNTDTNCYEPILIRDVDSLIANFGDPRIDPEKYIDLYSIMQVVANGTSCYVAKVDSGDPGIYEVAFIPEERIINSGSVNADISDLTNAAIMLTPDEFDWPDPTIEDAAHTKKTPAAVITGLHNKYNISGIFGHIDHVDAVPGHAAECELGSGKTLKAAGSYAGTKGNHLSLRITEGTESDTYDVTLYDNNNPVDSVLGVTGYADLCTNIKNAIEPSDGSALVFTSDDIYDRLYVFTGGEDSTPEVEEQTWELLESEYIIAPYEEVGDTFTLKIGINDPRNPVKIIIKSAELDPEYGREEIVLVRHISAGVNDKYDSSKTFDCAGLKRKYTITGIMDESDNTVFGSDLFTVEWEPIGNTFTLHITFKDVIGNTQHPVVTSAARQAKSIIAYSSMAEGISIECKLSQAKPFSLSLYYLDTTVKSDSGVLGTAKIKLEPTTTNQSIVNNLNAALQTYARFELADASTKNACEVNENGKNSIVKSLLDKYAQYDSEGKKRGNLSVNPQPLPDFSVLSKPDFRVTLQNYIDAQEQFKDRKYVGCMMADMAAPVTHTLDGTQMVDGTAVLPLDYDERRSLHYYLKQIACERKDTTVILSTPLWKDHTSANTFLTKDEACNWVASQGDYVDLWEYGQGATTDYATQSFYLEMYYSWLNQQCTKIENGLAKSVKVKTPPANIVINNILTSWRERGVQYPVAGDQYGTLPETCTVLQNPKTKLDRDQFVQYRINPIWDTGTRGVQIYGNETLNAGYTDLNAAHIARTLVYIRGRIDEYTETLKFSLNNSLLWDKWKTYVTQYILEPLISVNALSEYRIAMGEDTTSPEERANRQVNGLVQLIFYQSAEIFDLTYTVYSSSTTIDEAMANT